jgi:hypothetical protein
MQLLRVKLSRKGGIKRVSHALNKTFEEKAKGSSLFAAD